MDATTAAGDRLLATFSPDSRPAGRADMFAAGRRNEDLVLEHLRPALTTMRPDARWLPDDLEAARLPRGEWWVVDAVEGNVNHIHGMPEWGVTVTLVRDEAPVLTVVRQPIGDLTYSAVTGGGAFCNDHRMQVSAKTDLDAAIVATGQAEVGQTDTYRRIGASVAALLGRALVVRAFVPSTFPMLLVASGRHEAFWQYGPVLPGVAAGALFVREAGGTVSRVDGSAWRPGSPDIIVAAPGVHAAAVAVLRDIA
ncbi:inositol monophosphatase family protein [Tsukamurella soli]|uniref:inositol monophosphatase family protein n=1 Tax=Tsukamurella soli TaxID=644556 RepID=UPI003606E232